jgi:Uma2 family endonuclease
MAVATELLTYEQYMAEPEIRKRYDIIDGVRIFMTNPSIGHQETQGNIYSAFRAWRQANQAARVIMAPCDVLIRRSPLRTRQPDVLIISHERLGGRDLEDPSPLEPAPELVVEILSPSDTRTTLKGKLADYQTVGVQQCWIVNRKLQTVEVVRLTPDESAIGATYSLGETAQSLVFPGLTLAVAEVFAP